MKSLKNLVALVALVAAGRAKRADGLSSVPRTKVHTYLHNLPTLKKRGLASWAEGSLHNLRHSLDGKRFSVKSPVPAIRFISKYPSCMLFPLSNPTYFWSPIVGGRLFFYSPITFFSLAHEPAQGKNKIIIKKGCGFQLILHRCLDADCQAHSLRSSAGSTVQFFLVCGEIANEVDAHNRPALLALLAY
ncbi:uncharacterized protein F4807DRAFT_41762 [Annulohypoxylon truncatum]|uniref:uncharacterized protein n=1 Tax=Annulohypoxylon truncatum TaxID=327061 RepID=UPI00200808AD|nr:uncharacterized protein F4807DRAFT_41762 [Annulohypoxylon truncatum]KAI1210870.1 hypothetical protein F4807DRAFT_41762 [Annulohypoxylon truncatum]